MTIHARIKQRREALDLSMQDLAARIGVAWQTVQQWEKEDEEGGTAPKRSRIEAVARALETTPEHLLQGVDAQPFSSPSISSKDRRPEDWPFQSITKGEYQSLSAKDRRMIEILARVLVDESMTSVETTTVIRKAMNKVKRAFAPEGNDAKGQRKEA